MAMVSKQEFLPTAWPTRRPASVAEGFIDALAATLDVSESKYDEARQHYGAVGEWLAGDEGDLGASDPKVFPQGSTALGTLVKPGPGGTYDVDAVCLLKNPRPGMSPEDLKALVGERLKAHKTYARLLEPEGRRCWTLQYADTRFHLDVLPATYGDWERLVGQGVELEYAQEALCITDRTEPGAWLPSNPGGYALWFKDQSLLRLDDRRLQKAAEVLPIADYARQRLPLQRVVQLLKRHRDIMFAGHEHRPISMIITTLAAQAYRGQSSILTALLTSLPLLEEVFAHGRGEVRNPVHPDEVFTDKWDAVPAKRRAFVEWLSAIASLCREIEAVQSPDRIAAKLAAFFGDERVDDAMEKFEQNVTPIMMNAGSTSDALSLVRRTPLLYKQPPPWPRANPQHRARITARRANGDGYVAGDPLDPGTRLWFDLLTDVPKPFEVWWQVVNTGHVAARKRQLRGTFERSRIAGVGGVTQVEEAVYPGIHTIEAYVVKDGSLVAHAEPFLVRVR